MYMGHKFIQVNEQNCTDILREFAVFYTEEISHQQSFFSTCRLFNQTDLSILSKIGH